MTEQTLTCPNCHTEIRLTEALAAPLVEQIRQQFIAESRRKEQALAEREKAMTAANAQKERVLAEREKAVMVAGAEKERALAEQAKALAAQKAAVEHAKGEIDKQVAERLQSERAKIVQVESQKAQSALAGELKDLRDQLLDKDNKISGYREAELALRKQQRELEDKQRDLELQVMRQLDAERGKIREQAQREMDEQHRLKVAEKDQQLASLVRQIDEMKRKAEQGSQQAQGEALEVTLEEMLRQHFPGDVIEPVPKGVHGGDVVQRVRNDAGQPCGAILWESKRTKNYSPGWLVKLRDDQRAAQAEIAVLVTTAMPDGIRTFGQVDNIWITNVASAASVAAALRLTLLEVEAVKQAEHGRQGKMDVLYNYLSGPRFKQRVEAIAESFTTMYEDLQTEKKSMIRIWAKREKQIERVLTNTSGMHGDIAGIIGSRLPEIASLELKALAAEAEES